MNAYDNDGLVPADDNNADLVPAADDDLALAPADDDDDLALAPDADALADAADDADAGYRLQADGTVGLRLEPSGSADDSAPYALSADSGANAGANVNAALTGSTADAAPVAEPADAADVYGIASVPEPREAPKTRLERSIDSFEYDAQEKSSSKSKGSVWKKSGKAKKSFVKGSDDFAGGENEDVSLDTLYKRRQRAGGEEFESAKRRPLPARPFWDSLLKPFMSPGFLARVGMTAGAAFVPLLCATFFFSNVLSRNIMEKMANDDIGTFVAFYSCLWNDRVLFLIFCFLWGIFSAPVAFQIFVDTASGADEIDEWPEYNFVGGLGQFLWILVLMIFAGIPGAAFFSFIRLNYLVGMILSATVLTPVFFLSCMQADALFALVTKDVFMSLKRNAHSWLCFLGISFAFLFGTIGVSLAAIRSAIVTVEDQHISFIHAAIVAAILSLFFSFIPALYLRFLGRLAWIIEDDVRKREEEQAAGEDARYEPEEDRN